MADRLRKLGIVLAVIGVAFVFAGGYAYTQVQDGYHSLQKFSEAQNVTLSYNENGQLIDRGTTEGADAIMTLLTDEWGYPVDMADFDPNDPLVNTASEYMFQMATVGYHVLHGTQTVTLADDTEYNGEAFPAGEYEVLVRTVGDRGDLGGYWTDFDRMHPVEGPARSQAWSGTVHGLFGELGVGTVTASTLQMGLALAGILVGLGLTFMLAGGGLFWAGKGKEGDTYPVIVDSPRPEPANI